MPPKGADEVSRVSNQACWLGNPRRGCGIAPTPIFQKPRAQWPGRNRRKPLRFCAPEMFCPPQGVTPVMGVRGLAVLWARSARRPRPLAILWFLSHRWERNSPPAGGEIPLRKQYLKGGAPRSSRPTQKTALPSPPHPSRLRRATFPYPLCRFATSPLDKGSRPPRGRLIRRAGGKM